MARVNLLSTKARIAVIVLIGAVLTIAVALRAYRINTAHEDPTSTTSQTAPQELPVAALPGLPSRLKIPKINVDAPVEGLGLTPQGDLDIPKGIGNTGWFNAGPRPGMVGSAVIDGHFGLAHNKPAVFDELNSLQKGDLLYVQDGKDVTYRFVVSELRSYSPEDDANAVFRSTDGRAHLNLITCEGKWSESHKSYSARLVVFADLVTN
jgi:LPXTG-site transpeptidase (sortase) family protein